MLIESVVIIEGSETLLAFKPMAISFVLLQRIFVCEFTAAKRARNFHLSCGFALLLNLFP